MVSLILLFLKYSNYNMIKINSKSLFISKKNKKISLYYGYNSITECSRNELIIKVKYSSINYKDYLILNANPGLVRKFPHIAGIDAVGLIHKSYSKKFKKGDKVFIIGRPLGVNIKGGYSEFIKVPAIWVDHLPIGTSMKKMIFFGTPGLTAAIAVENILQNKNLNRNLPILVSGATGGVGMFAIIFLNKFGYKTESLVRNKKSSKLLKNIKNDKTINIQYLIDNFKLPINRKNYSAAIDNLGGNIVMPILSQIENEGLFISIGNVIDDNISISILPFILRGIKLYGLNTETIDNKKRKKLFNKYLQRLSNYRVDSFSSEILFKNLKNKIKTYKKNSRGRIIIKF